MVILCRHGATPLDIGADRIVGWRPIALARDGTLRAQDLAERLRDLPVHRILTSDLVRSVQTAQEISARLDLPIEALGAFRPWNLGDLVGQPAKTALPEAYTYLTRPHVKLPGGESFAFFCDRFLTPLRPLVADRRLFVVVTHSLNAHLALAVAPSRGRTVDLEMFQRPRAVEPGGCLTIGTDWAIDIPKLPKEPIQSATRSDKASVLYLHKSRTVYECRDCTMFIPELERCSIHGREDVIKPYGSCGLFVKGEPMPHQHPMGNVTTIESGYVESPHGFSCQRCEYFLPDRRDCQKVDPETPGDDPGIIHPEACCNAWEAR